MRIGNVRVVTGVAMIALVVTAAACGSSSSTKTATPKKAATTTTVAPTTSATTQQEEIAALTKVGPATATGKTVSLAKGPQGIFLIGPEGKTLYVFTKDSGTTSACTSDACAKAWPALTSKDMPTVGDAMNAAMVSTAKGQVADQVTYYGHLLYYFAGDSAPGDTNGTKIPEWDLLGPFGNVMLPH
jgi:predicted lipoprotein with Yx(FWY)xxD motif